jgi:hypothetical protein
MESRRRLATHTPEKPAHHETKSLSRVAHSSVSRTSGTNAKNGNDPIPPAHRVNDPIPIVTKPNPIAVRIASQLQVPFQKRIGAQVFQAIQSFFFQPGGRQPPNFAICGTQHPDSPIHLPTESAEKRPE